MHSTPQQDREKKKSNDWNCMRNALWIYECISTHPDDVRQWPGPRYYTERSIVRDLQPIFTFDSIHFIINFSLYERARAHVCMLLSALKYVHHE